MTQLDKLEAWVKEGRRCVDIEITTINGNLNSKTWIYDYDVGAGIHLLGGDDLPTTQDLKAIKIKQLKEELTNVESN